MQDQDKNQSMAQVRKRKRMAMEFPIDLVEEILLRVPAQSVVRLRSTCKPWKTLIVDHRFVNKHFWRWRGKEQQFMLVNDTLPSSSGSKISCVDIVFSELKNPCLNAEVVKPISLWYLLVYNVYHCDGLLLWVMGAGLLVLNPLLKKEDGSNKAAVDENFDGFFSLPLSNVCLKGTPYWLGFIKRGSTIFSIQSFNFLKERFEPVFLPSSFIESIRWGDFLSLGIFRGDHLSLLHQSKLTRKIHFWVKEKQHWNMLMTVVIPELTMFRIYSSYFDENNGKLVICGRHYETGSVSIFTAGESEEFQKFEYRPWMSRTIGGCYYVPSLLQVPGTSR
ncbi:hypothetical protein EUTSA_v10000539mg [Eutrema salsugineum]|uniref:F-box domain-containing protein n=1 Tax=Eutrema salsugineum TaxID=72664 RepID=V4L6Z0_EUTSA|nr:hypothetical protein EUTSA_v10000539mg [Eutrema salsugineum]